MERSAEFWLAANWQLCAERDQLRALADAARDGMRQLGEDLEASRAEVERLRAVVNDMGDLMADVRKQRDAAIARAEAAEALVAALRGGESGRRTCARVQAQGVPTGSV